MAETTSAPELTFDEFARTLTERVDRVPAVSFDAFVRSRGMDPADLPREGDVGEFIVGALTPKSRAARGRLKSVGRRLAVRAELYDQYREALLAGEIGYVPRSAPLRPEASEADRAYVRTRYQRLLARAEIEGRPARQIWARRPGGTGGGDLPLRIPSGRAGQCPSVRPGHPRATSCRA